MKVIHLISGGDTGGAKTHVHSLLENLGKLIDVTLVCFVEGPFSSEAREKGIHTIVLEHHNPFTALWRLKKLVKEGDFDLIHCHGARGNLMGILLRRYTRLPVVSTVHSDYRLDYLGRPFSRLTYGTINTIALRKLDYRIGVSDAMVDLLINRGFAPDRLFAIYNGLDFTPRPVAQDRHAFFRSVGLNADDSCVVAGIAARLNPVKDIATLIRGFAIAFRTCPHLRLLIAGDGEQKAELHSLARELGVSGAVCFAGWVSDVDSFYHAIDINTLTSLSETFPYALTEGARAALPTISSKVGGVPYLIDHGVTGLLFQAGDADGLSKHLITLAQDERLRRHLGQRLYNKAKSEFSLQHTVSRQLEIYNLILRRQQRPARKRDGALVCGAYGRGNAGDDAIFEAIVRELKQLDPDLPIWVLSRSPKSTRLVYRVCAIHTFDFLQFLHRMGKTRLYINGGGSLMQDVTSRRSLWYYLFTITAAKLRGNKVQMYGCGIGPINYPSNRRLAASVLQKNVDIITLRDAHSRQELVDMGVTAPKIILSADPTVILPAAPAEVVDGLLESEHLDPTQTYIGFTLRPWAGFSNHAAAFGAAADYVWETYGLIPVFIPIEPRPDNTAAREAAAYIKKAPYRILHGCASSSHTIGLFSRMTVVVSMRLHALIFSASLGVPVVGVVYDPKVSSFLSYIGQDLYLPLEETNAQRLCACIDKAVARSEDTAFLSAGIQRLREVEHRNSEAARELLECSD
ncbi:MAG: polysaccharide pyruvyl transferase CsaB [Oscillospiraceae bacterium]|nr:polysaccharide pyruvyl transferase CsaB [Oscillospiraceae bacterium]